MSTRSYYAPEGGLPPQTRLMTGRAVFTDSYAVIPKGCFSDILTSFLPGWEKTRLWLIARPMSGVSHPENRVLDGSRATFLRTSCLYPSVKGISHRNSTPNPTPCWRGSGSMQYITVRSMSGCFASSRYHGTWY